MTRPLSRRAKFSAQGLEFGNKQYPVVPGTNVSLFVDTSKMPSWAWALPAMMTCPGAKGNVCEHCYGMKGRHGMPNVKNCESKRLAWLLESMITEDGRAKFVDYMVTAIAWAVEDRQDNVFRVHETGDLYNRRYVATWIEIVKRLPDVKFWFPTKMWCVGKQIMEDVKILASQPNVTVRPSGLNIGDDAPIVEGFSKGATTKKGRFCTR